MVVVVVVVVDVALKWKIWIMLAFAPTFLGKLFFFARTHTWGGGRGVVGYISRLDEGL
jgi:hypothetical protein